MNKWQAIAEMAKGKKVFFPRHEKDYYFYINNKDSIVGADNIEHDFNYKCLDGWEIYEEKPELKKDPYLGKIVIQKSNHIFHSKSYNNSLVYSSVLTH